MELMGTGPSQKLSKTEFRIAYRIKREFPMRACVFLTAQKAMDEAHRHAFELLNPYNHLGYFPAVKGWVGVSRHEEARPIDAGGTYPHGAVSSVEHRSCMLRLSSCAAQ